VKIFRLTLAMIVGACLAISALAFTESAQASDGWTVVSRSSDSSSWFTSTHVYGFEGTQARLRVRTSRLMRVKIETRVSCYDADYATHVSRELAPSYRWVSRTKPLTRYYGATFAGASDCSFSVSVSSRRGRLDVTLASR
jgi:hypothetical protein